MRIIDAIYNIIDRVAPMSEDDKTELRRDAKEWLLGETKKLEDKPVKERNLLGKVVFWQGTWWFRTIVAVVFIWIAPQIDAYFRGDFNNNNEFDDES